MSEIAVIGSETFTLGFRLAGIRKIWNAVGEQELEKAVFAAKGDDQVSILVMEPSDIAALDERVRDDLETGVKPTLVAVGTEEDNSLRNKIKQAVGVDLW